MSNLKSNKQYNIHDTLLVTLETMTKQKNV